jgi:hypothetical protein
VGDSEDVEKSVDLHWVTTETPVGPRTYSGQQGSRREVSRPTAGDEGAARRSVDLLRVTREPPGGP